MGQRYNGRSVLIVEDDWAIGLELQSFFQDKGWRTLGPAPRPEIALALLDVEQPDLALVDVFLRGEPCTEVGAALRRIGVPMVLITGFPVRVLALKGAAVFEGLPNIGKPIDYSRLLPQVTDVMSSASA